MISREIEIEGRWLAWLCGLFEGIGTFSAGTPRAPNRSRIGLLSVERDIVARVCDLWGSPIHTILAKSVYQRPSYRGELVGGSAVALMQLMHMHMGRRRQAQIDAAISSYKPSRRTRHRQFTIVPPGGVEIDRYWLAGYTERKVFFGWRQSWPSSMYILASADDLDVIRRVQMIWLGRYGLSIDLYRQPPRRDRNSLQYQLIADGAGARLIIEDLYPLLGERCRAWIDDLFGRLPQSRPMREPRACYDVHSAA